ncbi:unnamed protein product [Rhizoctonia solani]|uniref:Uncharacterized protein n=1 Tax=Rhizoctonia solani TaxID=456999 RepID=A0A8H3B0U5_9AGAM|nr:unnamed protein product [Rhizoctonia solani]
MGARTNQLQTKHSRATTSVTPLSLQYYSPQPHGKEGIEPSPGPVIDQSKHTSYSRNRRATISSSFISIFVLNAVRKLKSIPGISGIQKLERKPRSMPVKVRIMVPDPSLPSSNKTWGFESSPKIELEQRSYSPTQRNVPGAVKVSFKLGQTSETKEKIRPEQLQSPLCSEQVQPSLDCPPKLTLKCRSPPGTDDESVSIRETQLALDSIICELVVRVKEFKCPLELDFSSSIEDHLVLKDNEKNKPFINQLRVLDGLRKRLAKIQTHENEQLEAKRRTTSAAIERTLQRMKEHQLKLRENYLCRK